MEKSYEITKIKMNPAFVKAILLISSFFYVTEQSFNVRIPTKPDSQ